MKGHLLFVWCKCENLNLPYLILMCLLLSTVYLQTEDLWFNPCDCSAVGVWKCLALSYTVPSWFQLNPFWTRAVRRRSLHGLNEVNPYKAGCNCLTPKGPSEPNATPKLFKRFWLILNKTTNQMQQFLKFITWCSCTAQHVSGVLTPILRSSATAVAASGFTVGAWW